jgi:colanic acid/amylovoran biosynthesis glycosyltransferase
MSGRIAYLMSRFPHLPETFILREMVALEQLGWSIELYPLIFQKQAIVHEQARPWLDRAHRLPWLSGKVIRANIQELRHSPGIYISSLLQVLKENLGSPKFLIRSLLLFPKAVLMAKMFRDENINHVHAHYATHPALAAWIIHKFTGISYSVTVHAHDIFVERPMLATKLRDSVQIVAISEYNKKYLVKMLGGWISDMTQVIRCGVDPALYTTHNIRHRENSLFEIISIGSLQPYKGQKFLIQACALLHEQGVRFRCRIIGGGRLRSELSKLIHTLGLSSMVELLGPKKQDEVAQMLSEADCYVQPSVITSSGKMEGVPVALMEAMASGVPVIATSISGIPELVKNGETGWLVLPEDVKMLADAIKFIYEEPAKARLCSDAARKLILSDFELHSNVQKLSYLFNQIVTNPQTD